tara:strand:+ start:545 stop:838 length:294 start_codon:yes stop_codon:yes gene_type:complete
MADRNKYPPTKTAKALAYEYANAHPRKVVLDNGKIQQKGKWYCPPIEPVTLCRTLVDIGYLYKKVKGSPWKWVDEYRVMKQVREFPYERENVVYELD